jgi:UPF0716 protein FxsA
LRLFPLLIIAYLLAEIAVLVAIGGEIGVLATILIIIATAFLGAILLRVQGFGILARIRSETDAGRVPGRELVHGVMIVIAGILLMTPGFISDALGLLLFLPPFRDLGWSLMRQRIRVAATTIGGRKPWGPRRPQRTIELGDDDYTRHPDGRIPRDD